MTVYYKIGKNYFLHRKADRRIVETAFGLLHIPKQGTVAEIGAGTGNYSNAIAEKGIDVIAVEPALNMVLQAVSHTKVKWIGGTAEQIPISNSSIDGILIILAIHHFRSLEKAARECNRIIKNEGSMVIFTFDPRQSETFWLNDYFPAIWDKAFKSFDSIDSVAEKIANDSWMFDILPFLLPDDLTDKFMASCWKYPEMYLEKQLRESMSAFALANPVYVDNGIRKLKEDLCSGFWDKKYGAIRNRNEIDLGYRFIRYAKK